MRWSLLLTPPLPAAENMALDEALLARARETGTAVLRVYAWDGPALSLGRHQTARGVYSAEAASRQGVAVVRRLTGGRAVLHHREVTYSVTAPARDEEPLRESYERINRLLLDGLRRLGVPASAAQPAGRTLPPGSAPCFEVPAAGELVVGGRKLVGSAQVREDGALLQHGSILVEDDQGMLGDLSLVPLPEIPGAATLGETLGRSPSLEEVAEALFAAVRGLEDPGAEALAVDAPLLDASRRARDRYLDDAWTWRR